MPASKCFVPVLSIAVLALNSAAQSEHPDAMPVGDLAGFETVEPVEITGRFLYATHRFGSIASPVRICMMDHWRSGGGFFCCTVSNGVPAGPIFEIAQCERWDWYRLDNRAGTTNLAVVSMHVGDDRDDDRGISRLKFACVFHDEAGTVRRTTASRGISDMLDDPDFKSMERLTWFFAKRSDSGTWGTGLLSTDPDILIVSNPGSPPSREQTSALLARAVNDGLVPTNGLAEAVFEADAGRTPFFALVSPESSTNVAHRIWSAYCWDGTEWTAAPTNGFACASGRCPATINAGTNDFYHFYADGAAPRLVVLKPAGSILEEPLWEAALGSRKAEVVTETTVATRDWMSLTGWKPVPSSVFQALGDISHLFRLKRVHPVILAP